MAVEDSTKDFHLARALEYEYLTFFDKPELKDSWDSLLSDLEAQEIRDYPAIRATSLYGKWVLTKDYKLGLESAEEFLKAASDAEERGWMWLISFSFEKAIGLFRMFDKKRTKEVGEEIHSTLHRKKTDLPRHALLSLLNEYLRVKHVLDAQHNIDMLRLARELAYATMEGDHFRFQRGFLDVAIDLAGFLKDEKIVHDLKLERLQSMIKEAEAKGKNPLNRHHFLSKALEYCIETVQDPEKTKELKREVAEIDMTSSLKEIKPPDEEIAKLNKAYEELFKASKKAIDRKVDFLQNLPSERIVATLVEDPTLFRIDVDNAEKLEDNLSKAYPLRHLFGKVIEVSDRTLQVGSEEEMKRIETNRYLTQSIQERIWFWDEYLGKLEERFIISAPLVCSFLIECRSISNEDFVGVMEGIERHFMGDYIGSIHLLCLRLENLLCSLLEERGADVTSVKANVFGTRELGGLLSLEECEEFFGKDLTNLMRLFLVEQTSFHFRNRLAHGKVVMTEFNSAVSRAMLLLALQIAHKSYVNTSEGESSHFV